MKFAYVVLGMHRSGTSSVAGTLALMGATAPRTLMGPAPDNPKGFWESSVLMAFNDDYLGRCGSAWNDWRPLNDLSLGADARLDLLERAATCLDEEFKGSEVIVLKDPRICRFYDFWRTVLVQSGYQPIVVSPLRAPQEVAASLAERNAVTYDEGLALWLRHVLEAEAATRGQPRLFIDWTGFLADWAGDVERIRSLATGLGASPLVIEPAAIDAFVSRDLRHHRSGIALGSAPAPVDEAYEALSAMTGDPDNGDCMARLDEIRRRFDMEGLG